MSPALLTRRPSLSFATGGVAAVALLLGGCSADTTEDAAGRGSAVSVDASPVADSTAEAVTAVTEAANTFLDTLDDDQKSEVLLDFNEENAAAWSNLPCGSSCRVGITFGDLSDEQLTAAKAVLEAATGTSTGTGYDQVMQILAADDVLGDADTGSTGTGGNKASVTPGTKADTTGSLGSSGSSDSSGDSTAASTTAASTSTAATSSSSTTTSASSGGTSSTYSSDNYYLAFLGEPSTDGTWELHFGGHHLAVNVTYDDGTVAGASPFFIGVEPKSWTEDGTTYAPLDVMKEGMYDMINSLDEDQLATAKLDDSYTDVLLGPDEDGNFPETKEGIRVSELSTDQQALVLTAMKPWVQIADDQTAEDLLAVYEDELADTYISYSGETDLTAQGDYVRIDGPSAWMEFVCQDGVVYSDEIHYHTVYRDHTRDYGGQLSF